MPNLPKIHKIIDPLTPQFAFTFTHFNMRHAVYKGVHTWLILVIKLQFNH